MNLLKLYIKQHIKGMVLVLSFFAVFTVSFFLYRLPVEVVVYPTALCLLIGMLFLMFDYGRVKRKHLKLLEIQRLMAAMISDFPDIECVEDADYQQIIETLKKENEEFQISSSAAYENMMDYYTVWVHQIKTPIASMKLNLQNEDTPLSRKLSSDLFRIEQYVEMVLAYLRLDSVSSDYMFKEYCVDTIIRQTVKKFASEFITRKIRLDYQPVMETIITDDKWLSFVLEQLLSNALKYTGEGGSVKICMEEPKTLCIEDTGIGIAPEDLPRIFERGYTGYNGHRDKRASGIGLYLCKRICQNLGAEITAASEPGKGTAIRINLEQYNLRVE